MSKKLKRNRVKCLDCGKILESFYQHDYKTCGCPQETMVDGGLVYERYGGMDLSKVETMFEYVDEDTFLWVTKVDGKSKALTLSEIEDSHLQNIAHHLRTRLADTVFIDRHHRDIDTLEKHVLPELEKRGLTEPEKEVPHK